MDDFEILVRELGENVGLLAAMALIYVLAGPRLRRLPHTTLAPVTGAIFGLFAIVAMVVPVHLVDGVIVDARNIILVLAGPVGGPVAAVVAGAVASAFRLYLGGAGALAGTLTIVISVALGVAAVRRWGLAPWQRPGWRLLALGCANAAATIPAFLLIGSGTDALAVFLRTAPAWFVWLPLGTVTMGFLATFELRRRAAEERLADFTALSSDWVWETDADRRITYISDRVARSTGLAQAHFLDRLLDDVVAEWDGGADSSEFAADLAGHRPFKDLPFAIDRPTGCKWFRLSGVPRHDAQGRFLGYRGISVDTTAEVAARAEIERAEALLHDAIESMPGGVLICDKEGRIAHWNRQFDAISELPDGFLERGRPFKEMLAKAWDTGVFAAEEDDRDSFIARRMERFWNPGEPLRRTLRDGRVLHIEERRTSDGGVVSVRTDITAEVSARRAAERAERLLSDAIESMPGGVVICDPDGRVVLHNRTYREMYAHTFASLGERGAVGMKFEDLMRNAAYDGDVLDAVGREGAWLAERMDYFWNAGEPMEQILPDGSVILINERRTSEGGVVGVRTDITHLRRQQEALTVSEARFRDFAETASDWFWEADTDLRVSYVSDRIRDALGIDPSRVLGWSHADLIAHEPDRGKAKAYLRTLESRRPFRDFRYSYPDRRGRPIYISVSGRPTYDAAGQFTGYRGTASNVTHLVEAQHALEEARDQAEIASRAKSEFLANMSHELRTPLNAINGFSEVIANEVLGPIGTEKYKEYAQDIRASGEHLLSLINDVLDLSKIEAGKFDIHEELISLPSLLRSSQRLVAERARRAGVTLVERVKPDLPPLLADERGIKQMLLNLLTNAIKFTMRGGTVTIEAWCRTGGAVSIAISDTGIGIAPEDVDKVLQPFGQADNPYTRSREGTGLGLPLVKSLIELHGGAMEIESTSGHGTTVTLHFPPERGIGGENADAAPHGAQATRRAVH